MVKRKVKKFNITESYTSLVLGAIVVLIAGILFVSFTRVNKGKQASSVKEEPKAEQQNPTIMTNDSKTSSSYTIKPGDDLWSISEDIYKDGYKWVEIAKLNKLEDPGVIHVGSKLIIPEQKTAIKVDPAPTTQNTVAQNISITGNTYKIKEGDNLWDISVRAYGDGYKWVELARVNNLENPDLIFSDNVLKIPR